MSAETGARPVVVEALTKWHGRPGRGQLAVDDVSFGVSAGRTTALVGESGAGKSTIASILTGGYAATSGKVVVCGEDRSRPATSGRGRRRRGAQLQLVPQDPNTSLDPTQTVGAALAEVLSLHGSLTRAERGRRVVALLESVGLAEQHARATPRRMSGGQRQRVAIARALAADPAVIVLDEAVSALDVSVQAQVLNLLRTLQTDTGTAYLFITHDLAVVRQVADDVIVMRNGRVVEQGPTSEVLDAPTDSYTRLLLASTPRAGWRPVRRVPV